MSFFRRLKRFPFLSVIVAAALVAAAVIVQERIAPRIDEAPPRTEQVPRGSEQALLPEARTAESRRQGLPPLPSEPKIPGIEEHERQIAVIIDDIGYDLGVVDALIAIDAPIACAILPHTPHARDAALRLHAAGKEILLHLPMEPHAYPAENPGAGALFVRMDEGEIRRELEADLSAVPHARGVNNHMGSRFMEDEAGLDVVMRELAKRGLYFVDSLTTPRSRGRVAATKAGVRYAARAVFIDHAPGHTAALANLLKSHRRGGKGEKPLLMIGHPYPGTIRALREVQPLWEKEGVRMIPLPRHLALRGGHGNKAMLAHKAGEHRDPPGREATVK